MPSGVPRLDCSLTCLRPSTDDEKARARVSCTRLRTPGAGLKAVSGSGGGRPGASAPFLPLPPLPALMSCHG
jgi:hypothetical protein